MVEIEVNGIPCLFNEEALDDFDVLEHLAKLENGNLIALVPFARALFGDEQLDNIKSQLRDESGICKRSAMEQFVTEALNQASKAKKVEPKTNVPCPCYQRTPVAGSRRLTALFRPELRPNWN